MIGIRPIKTEQDYDWAIREITRYFENVPVPGSDDGNRFDVLADLIAAYENKPHNRSQSDLSRLLGSNSRASEVLSRKRRLSIDMVHRLRTQ